jgi:hypothetical protein
VDVQDDLGSHELGKPSGKDLKVWNGVDVDQMVPMLQLLSREEKHRPEEK